MSKNKRKELENYFLFDILYNYYLDNPDDVSIEVTDSDIEYIVFWFHFKAL